MGLNDLARLQFATTTLYHFIFVPLTIGLSLVVAVMQTAYVRTGDENYKRMTKFWGKLFLINFAMGVVTGIVQEFQFGMSWSEYSRFVGDIFGAPLAIEALMAFFIESTFIGLWIFGWDKLSKKVHLATIWLVAAGTTLSSLWILIANGWMQHPVGYEVVNGRAQMTDFGAIVTNPNVFLQFPHVVFGAFTTAGFFIVAISAYRLLRERTDDEHLMFVRSMRIGLVFGLAAVLVTMVVGHLSGQFMLEKQPMKLAAAGPALKIEGVTLRYGGGERPALVDFSLHAPHGARLLITGESGAGKSSLINLLLRFVDYEAGRITVGGVNLRALTHESVRQTFGVMTQRTHLFNTTIRENVRIGRKSASDEEIVTATRMAQIHDFIQTLPDGYETYVGEGGALLSGGERQRLALARMLLKDAPIWLLDEITANLDPVTAIDVLQAVITAGENRTVILMTHRPELAVGHRFDDEIRLAAGSRTLSWPATRAAGRNRRRG